MTGHGCRSELSDGASGEIGDRGGWWRRVMLVLAGAVGVGVAVMLGASFASASTHATRAGSSSPGGSGVTLCAGKDGAVTYVKGSCPKGEKALSVGSSRQVNFLTRKVASLKSTVKSLQSTDTSQDSEISGLQSSVSSLQSAESSDASKISSLQSAESSDASAINSLQSAESIDASKISSLQSAESSNASSISSVRSAESSDASAISSVQGLLTGVSRGMDADGYETLTFAGENVAINDGGGDEDAKNGLGNLIIGYDQDNDYQLGRAGSNNLIVGDDNGWDSYGGLVAGAVNDIKGAGSSYSSVSGGNGNVASNQFASVSGGAGNTAPGEYASVSGGALDIASGNYASVSGGNGNKASGDYTSILGGYHESVSTNDCASIPATNTSANCGP